jgi:hypothetical protein
VNFVPWPLLYAYYRSLFGPNQGSLRAVRMPVTADHFQDIEKFEADLWKIADNLPMAISPRLRLPS